MIPLHVTAHGIRGRHMNKQEVITGLYGLRLEMERQGREYEADVIADATFRLIPDSRVYE